MYRGPPPLSGGLRRQDNVDISDPTVPAPPITPQERNASISDAGAGEGGGEDGGGTLSGVDLIPRVEATLVPHDDVDDDPQDGGGGENRQGEGDARGNGHRRSSIASSDTGPVSINPVDFAHTVAIPASTVIPIPETTGSRDDDDFSDNKMPTNDDLLGGKSADEEENKMTSRRKKVYAALACLLAVAAAIAAGVVVATQEGKSEEEDGTTSTTNSTAGGKDQQQRPDPDPEPRAEVDPARLEAIRAAVLSAYKRVLGPDGAASSANALHDESTDQYAALRWVTADDPANVHHSYTDRLVQRYASAAVFLGTGGKIDDSTGRIDDDGDGATSWLNPFYFLSGRHECDWIEDPNEGAFWGPRGIACDRDFRVQSVSLYSNNLTGTVPAAELALLGGLYRLYLIGNDVRGTVPSEMGLLTSASEIMLSGNRRLGGTVPTELGGLSDNLRVLSMWGTRLSGTIPTELGRLTNLERLALNNCSVTGEVPDEVGDISIVNGGKLGSMYVQFTGLTRSMEHLCPAAVTTPEANNSEEEIAEGWVVLEADCLEKVECSCCTKCY